MQNLAYHRPTTVAEAESLLLAIPGSHILAGGQTLLNRLKTHAVSASALIDLGGIDLNDITVSGQTLSIGSGATHDQIAQNPEIQMHLPAFAALVAEIGDQAVRNRGSIGGALAVNDPSGDYPAALLALGATVVTQKRVLPARDYFKGRATNMLELGEVILRIDIDLPKRAAYARMKHPATGGALVSVFSVENGASFTSTVSGVAATGAEFMDVIQTAAPSKLLDDQFGSARYRQQLARVLERRANGDLSSA